MIVLHFSMQGEYFFNVLMEIVMCLHFGLQKEDISKHSNSKCPWEVHSIVKLNTTCNKKKLICTYNITEMGQNFIRFILWIDIHGIYYIVKKW